MIFQAVLLISAWIAWRLYRFTLLPLLWPQQVKELPYWIPFLGHAISIFKDIDGTLTYGRKYFGNTRATFTLTVAGQKIYVMTSAQNISAALNNLHAFNNGKPKVFLMQRFGISNNAIRTLYEKSPASLHKVTETPLPKTLAATSEGLINRQLNPGHHYDEFERTFLGVIDDRLRWDQMVSEAVVPKITKSKPGVKAVSLLKLVRQTLVTSNIVAFFGSGLMKINPDFGDQFLSFDDDIKMFLQKLPTPWGNAVETAMEAPLRSLKTYLENPKEQRTTQSWVVGSLEEELRSKRLGTEDIAKWFFMLFWASNTNTWRLAFWVSAYLVHNPSLMADVRREVEEARSQTSSLSSFHKHLSRCTVLKAVYHEALRLVDSPISIRESTCRQASALGEEIPAGATVMLAHRQLLQDEDVWGPDAGTFNPERFLQNESLYRSKSFTPFGGGGLLCPGRFMARGEVLVFVAFLLDRFDVETAGPFPRLDLISNAGVGVLGVQEGDDSVLLMRERRR